MRHPILVGLVLVLLGCSTAAKPAREGAAPIADASILPGKWQGRLSASGGTSVPLEIIVARDTTYTFVFGPNVLTGNVIIADGVAVFTQTGGSGALGSAGSTSRAELGVRGDRRVLVGHGRSMFGPFSYEVTEMR